MPRNAKPIELHKKQGNPNRLTKADIKRREESEIKLGSKELLCPAYVKNDTIAFSKWREIKHIYKDVDFVSSGDVSLLGRYCKTSSEYQVLLKAYQRVSEIHYDCKDLDESLDGDYYDEEDDKIKALFSYKVKKQLRDLFSIGAILTIESAINKKMDMLIKMEDRLFLNPLAKVKNVPKKEEKKADPLDEKGFGNV